MSVKVTFECDGCFAEAGEPVSVKRRFESFSGRGHGFGVEEKVSDLAPDGWIAFDPFTSCTYCPDCWASITNGTAAA